MSTIQWLPVSTGHLALGSKPKKRKLADLGATTILTLLAEREGAREIGEAAARAGLSWIWLPLENGRPPARARDQEIEHALDEARAALGAGGRVLVHCSAGIHRTGMMGYALMRLTSFGVGEARDGLARMRPVCAASVGKERLAWGDAFVVRALEARQ